MSVYKMLVSSRHLLRILWKLCWRDTLNPPVPSAASGSIFPVLWQGGAMRTVTRPDHNVEIIMRVNLIAYLWLCWYTYHHYILIINIALWHSLHNISAVLYCAHDGRWYSATPCRQTFKICFFLRRVKRLKIRDNMNEVQINHFLVLAIIYSSHPHLNYLKLNTITIRTILSWRRKNILNVAVHWW